MSAPAQTNTDATAATDTQTTPADSGATQEPATDSLLTGEADNSAQGEAEEGTLLTADENAEGEAQEPQSAPEKYDDFTTPEGFKLEEGIMAEFTDLARKSNLSQEAAQGMLDMAAKHVQSMVESQRQEFTEMRKTWVNDIKNDTEFGGPKFKDTLVRAQRALKKFGDEDIRETLKSSGFGDNPSLIKLLARMDKAAGEDQAPTGEQSGTVNSGPLTLGQALYGGK